MGLDEVPELWPFEGMGKSRLLGSTTLVSLLAGTPVMAADLAPVAPVKYREAAQLPWTGFYVGANVGWAESADPRVDCLGVAGLGGPCGNVFPAPKAKGFEYGLQAGYNWQVGNFVLGVEGDINKLTAQGLTGFPGIDTGKGPDQLSSRYDWLGTMRGRAGVTTGSALFYATGGYAYGRVGHHYTYALGSPANTQHFDISEGRSGWTVGGGAEYALNAHWSLKAEYLYVHLAASNLDISGLSANFFGPNPPGTNLLRYRNDLNIARVGVNYRF
jgi:outer membrane immunogenic protein